jgi:hypothetical protein
MGNLLHTFAIGGDAVFGLVAVAIWIWLSVVSKRGKDSRRAQPPPVPGSHGAPHDPQSELRKFFETLEKGLDAPAEEPEPESKSAGAFQSPPTTTLPPVPRRAPRPPPERPAIRPAPPPLEVAIAMPPLAAAAPTAIVAEVRPATAGEPGAFPVLSSPRIGALRSREGLRHAIVAAEILGPPVSMRQPSTNSGRP